MIGIAFTFCGLLFFAALLRLLPHKLAPNGLGVDHWYWKNYIREYRDTKRFPPELKQYLLDEHQWYPPMFPIVLSWIPDWLFDKYDHILAAIIDLLRMFLLLMAAWYLTGSPGVVVVAGMIYATFPMLVSYNVQLNSRVLGALFLDLISVTLLHAYMEGAEWWHILLVALFSGLMLLAHKMTAQLYWFVLLVFGLFTGSWPLLALIPVSLLSAVIISKGFYLKVLRHHWDIVSFWNRNWPWLTAHPILQSPVYGEEGYVSPGSYHRKGVAGFVRRLQFLLGFGPAAWIVVALAGWLLWQDGERGLLPLLSAWTGVILLFVVLTTIVPWMKCLGNGYLYLYNVVFPASLLAGILYLQESSFVMLGGLAFALLLSALAILRYCHEVKTSKTLKVDDDLLQAVEYLAGQKNATVMCLPLHWSEVVAYKTGMSVVWGAHGYGFKKVEPIFPRLMEPIGNVIGKYHVKYLMTGKGYLPEKFLDALPESQLKSFGDVRIYEIVSPSEREDFPVV